jgi:ABC-type multidrug transport system fused ATPase/permease subunit
MTDHADDVMGAVESALKPHVDDDTCEYISSLLEEDPSDQDAREAVQALIEGACSVDGSDSDLTDGVQLCQAFFELLDLSCTRTSHDNNKDKDNTNTDTNTDTNTKDETVTPTTAPLRKLEQAVIIGDKDVQSFASGLQADGDSARDAAGNDEKPGQSKIAAFYANMIDVKDNYLATSERVRRKARQKEIRERMEEEERQRAIEEAMAMFTVTPGAAGGDSGDPTGAGAATVDTMMDNSSDNAQDVHFRNLDLPNLRGGGENLLQNANIMLARGKRYGLMGRNGCGTLLILLFTVIYYMPRSLQYCQLALLSYTLLVDRFFFLLIYAEHFSFFFCLSCLALPSCCLTLLSIR